MPYRYHNQKLKYSVEAMLKEFKMICDGRNLSIADLTKNEEGYYSEEKFLKFLDELVSADRSDIDDVGLDSEYFKKREEEETYLKTLLYVLIRSMQAKIGFFTCDYGVEPYTEDSFEELLRAVDPRDWPITSFHFGRNPEISHLISESMEATARSVYHYLTGEDMEFPCPIRMKKEEAEGGKEDGASADGNSTSTEEGDSIQTALPEDSGDKSSASAASEAGNSETEDEDYDSADDGVFYTWDDDILTPEERDAQWILSTRLALQQEHDEWFIHSDPQSEAEWQEDEEEANNYFARQRKYRLKGRADAEEIFKKQQRNLKLLFPCPDEFIKKYKELKEYTHPGCESALSRLPKMIESYLENNDYTLYSDEETCEKVFNMIYATTREVLLSQGKK